MPAVVICRNQTGIPQRRSHKPPGIQYPDAPWHPDPVARSGLVKLSGRDEVMTRAEFEQRYPNGTIIRVEYSKAWPR